MMQYADYTVSTERRGGKLAVRLAQRSADRRYKQATQLHVDGESRHCLSD